MSTATSPALRFRQTGRRLSSGRGARAGSEPARGGCFPADWSSGQGGGPASSGTREGQDQAATGRGTLPGWRRGARSRRGNEESRFLSLLGALSSVRSNFRRFELREDTSGSRNPGSSGAGPAAAQLRATETPSDRPCFPPQPGRNQCRCLGLEPAPGAQKECCPQTQHEPVEP